MKSIWIIIGVLAVVSAGVYFWMERDSEAQNDENGDEIVYCTMDAMECPDGSYVGRVGPSCEFAPCPERTSTEPIIQAETNASLNGEVKY